MNLKPIKRLFVLGTTAAAVGSAVKKRLEGESLRAAYLLPDYFTVTAHTGCNNTPDNTLESLQAGIDSGADIIELDVLDNEDSTVLMCHDYLPDEEHVTFEEALEYIKAHSDTVKVNVDIKRSHVSFAADEIIRRHGMSERCFFTGVNEEDAQLVAATVSIPYYINVRPTLTERFDEEYWIETVSKVNMLGAVGVNCDFKLISKKAVEICQKNSLLVSLFTPNSENEINFALTLLPDNITTRNPQTIIDKRRIKKC